MDTLQAPTAVLNRPDGGTLSKSVTPSILSLPIKNPTTLISIYEGCLKPLYTLNVTLLDKLHNRSGLSLLLIHLHRQFIDLFKQLNGFKKLINLSRANNDDSLSNFCFVRSMLAEFDTSFGLFLEELDAVNGEIFVNAKFLGLVPLKQIYYNIVSKDNGELFVLKDVKLLDKLRVQVLLQSDSLQLYKELDGQFDAKKIVSDDLGNFHTELARTMTRTSQPINEIQSAKDDLQLVSSPEFKQFNARRLQLLGLFDKRIF